MLGKMLKQDFKATSRFLIPMILVFITMCVINKISYEFELANQLDPQIIVEIFSILFMIFYILSAIALGILTQVFIAMHFYKTMTGNEGYLTHTLPVKTTTIINSKLLTAAFWQIVVTILIFLSVLLLLAGHISMNAWNEFFIEFHSIFGKINVLPFLLFIVGVFYTPLMYYVSIAIGHLFHKHRLGASILSFIAIYLVISTITSIITSMDGSFINIDVNNIPTFRNFYNNILLILLILSTLITIVFYVSTNIVFTKKLNLE